ncbi:MAG: class III extradiol ring-cleavage dioxygenase [Burkholderiales bacterium]
MSRLPTLFVSHGAPTFALDPGMAGAALKKVGASLPPFRAILMISAHWETDAPAVSSAVQPETIHDFYGFPAPLYRLRYPAPGAPALADRVAALLTGVGLPVHRDPVRGLDHGAWVPLMHMVPAADLPVAQLSFQLARGPAHHFAVGQALAPLTDEGVLIIGSGGITHNLSEFRMLPENAGEAPYVREFREWMAERTLADDMESLVAYRTQAPHAARAHPTEDHLLPFFTAFGAAHGAGHHLRAYTGVTFGVIGMDSYVFAADRLVTSASTAVSDASPGRPDGQP